jgi:cysteine desulfurase/selenocysteine lyase
VTFNVKEIRDRFPILATQANGIPLCYLDCAATTPMPDLVLAIMQEFETSKRGNVSRSAHYLATQADEAYQQARQQTARYINAESAEEIVFTSGTTASINLLANSLGSILKAGDEVVISLAEHHSNFIPWQMLRDRCGIVLKAIGLTDEGRLDLSMLDDLVSDRCRLIAVGQVSNVTGAITDVKRITSKARSVGAQVLLDGAQAVPHGPVDVQDLGVDYYAFSGHKCFAPNGIGVLWGREDALDKLPPFMGGGGMVERVSWAVNSYASGYRRFEAGTPPIAQAVGMGAALDWMMTLPWPQIKAHETALIEKMLTILNNTPELKIIGPNSTEDRIPIFSFDIAGYHPHDLCYLLDQQGIALRGGHHCAQPLMDVYDLMGTSRASLSFFNHEEDIERFAVGLNNAIDELRL